MRLMVRDVARAFDVSEDTVYRWIRQEKLPAKFLEQIMTVLKRSGFVESVKGKNGGYALARPAAQILVGDIIRAIDGPLAPMATAKEIEKRIEKEERHAGLYQAMLDVRNAISAVLDHMSLADVCEKSLELAHSKRARPMYYI